MKMCQFVAGHQVELRVAGEVPLNTDNLSDSALATVYFL
jgi:hypothetical protein